MQFRPSRYWFKMGLVLVFTTYVPLHYLVGICRDFCLFKTFSDPVHASELRPQSHRRQINGSVIWGGETCFDWHNMRQMLHVRCIIRKSYVITDAG
jgi:hypothetical protein